MKIPNLSFFIVVMTIFNYSFVYSNQNIPFLTRLEKESKYILTAPSRINEKGKIITSSIIVTTGMLFILDETIRESIQEKESSSLDTLSSNVEFLGNGLYDIGLLGIYWTGGYITKNNKAKETAIMGLESFLIAGGLTLATKVSFGRARPYEEKGSTTFRMLTLDNDFQSFPSGHTSSAFSLASVFADQYDEKAVDIVSYGLASLVGLSRIYDNQHWASDVFIGAVLGIVSGKTITYLHRKNFQLTVLPFTPEPNENPGIMLSYKF